MTGIIGNQGSDWSIGGFIKSMFVVGLMGAEAVVPKKVQFIAAPHIAESLPHSYQLFKSLKNVVSLSQSTTYEFLPEDDKNDINRIVTIGAELIWRSQHGLSYLFPKGGFSNVVIPVGSDYPSDKALIDEMNCLYRRAVVVVD